MVSFFAFSPEFHVRFERNISYNMMRLLLLLLFTPILLQGQSVELSSKYIHYRYPFIQPLKVLAYNIDCSEVTVSINEKEYEPNEFCEINIGDQFPFGFSGVVNAVISYQDTSFEQKLYIPALRSTPAIYRRSGFASYSYRALEIGLSHMTIYFDTYCSEFTSGFQIHDWKTIVYRLGQEVMNQRQSKSDSTFVHFQLYPGDVVVIDSMRYSIPVKADTLFQYTTDPFIAVAQ